MRWFIYHHYHQSLLNIIMTSPKRRRDESRSPASKDAKKLKVEDDGTPDMNGGTNGVGHEMNGVTADLNGVTADLNGVVPDIGDVGRGTPPPIARSTASVSPTKKNGPLAEVQNVFGATSELSAVGRDKSVWILANTEALFGDLPDEEWKQYADKVAGALAMLRREWLELEDKRRQLTGGRKRRKA
ncbi:hypothetical protein B0I71DRAFT_124713 [Yarrowia lipolytica]|uniref:Uncharacterized protein n=1 Tax=Yarrowia lipolytica TaxID=4952 RepID=A0A371BYL9_YARLL|nr:hypothetical protein B0I71DRAFT_124713 [Yarrowia lipolytica]